MSKDRNKLIALALVGAGSFVAWKAGSALLSDEAQGTKHAVNQLWIDRVPRDDRDMITHLVMLDHPQGKYGAVGRSSQWRHMIDVFQWQLQGDKLGLYFPQERAKARMTVKTWECEGEAPAPFELCMKMTNEQGRSWMLYSREDWEINPRDAEDSLAEIVDDQPTLAAVLGTLDDDHPDLDLDLAEAESWPEVNFSP